MTSVSLSTWTRLLSKYNIDINGEYVETYEAAGDHSLELLAVLREIRLLHGPLRDTAACNPFQLRATGSFSGSLTFPTNADGVAEAVRQEYYAHANPSIVEEIQAYDALPPPAPPPEPEHAYQPREYELRAWYGSLEPYDPVHPVAALWYNVATHTGFWPTLSMINDDEPHRQLWSFTNGMKIVWDGDLHTPAQIVHS